MVLAIDITDGCGLSNEASRELLLKKEQGNAVLAFLFAVNSRLTSCTLLTRRSISVLKVSVTCRFRSLAIKEDWSIVLRCYVFLSDEFSLT